jgi:hypothetical protein
MALVRHNIKPRRRFDIATPEKRARGEGMNCKDEMGGQKAKPE